MYMADYVEHLDNVLKTTGEKVLQGSGTISHTQAIEKATEEYRKYQEQSLSPVEEEYLESIKNIHSTIKKNGKNWLPKCIYANDESGKRAYRIVATIGDTSVAGVRGCKFK